MTPTADRYAEGINLRGDANCRIQIASRPELQIQPLPYKKRVLVGAFAVCAIRRDRLAAIDPSSIGKAVGPEDGVHKRAPRSGKPLALRRLHRALGRVGDAAGDP